MSKIKQSFGCNSIGWGDDDAIWYIQHNIDLIKVSSLKLIIKNLINSIYNFQPKVNKNIFEKYSMLM